MGLFKAIETLESCLDTIPIKPGQMIFCSDSRNIYMDNYKKRRIEMTDIIKLKTEVERADIIYPTEGKMYLVEENNRLYRYKGLKWEVVSTDISVNTKSVSHTKLVPCTLQQNKQPYGPRTLASSVYMDDGKTVRDIITELKTNSSAFISITRFKNTVSIEEDTNTVDIGIEEYNKDTDILFVYKNSVYIEEGQEYTILDNNSIRKNNGTWSAEYGTTFNFVVIAPKSQEAVQLSLEDHETYIKQISKLTEKVNRYESMIYSLNKKLSSLEKRLK